MSFETIRLERPKDGIAVLTLNRPEKKNAMNIRMFEELRVAFQSVSSSTKDRALIVTGAGDAFCSGADLSMEGSDGRSTLDVMRGIHGGPLALSELPIPTIAKVNGVAAGAGLNLGLGCDLIVASDRARFSEIFVKRGLSVDFGGSWLLPRLIGLHRAKELVFFGDILSADEAERIGLVNRVLPHEQLDEFVDDWAERLAANPPVALGAAKRLLNAGLTSSMSQALENEGLAQAVCSRTEDTREAFQAFLEKRAPVFKGR